MAVNQLQFLLGEPVQHFQALANNTTVNAAQAGRALHVRIPTATGTAGTVVVTAQDSTTDTIECPLGSSIWQIQCINASASGAVGAVFTNWS